MPFDPKRFNDSVWEQSWRQLNAELEAIVSTAGLPPALRSLVEQQIDNGFIRDTLKEVRVYSVPHPGDPNRRFIVIYNPRRLLRFDGAGRPDLPPGRVLDNGGCYLDRSNVLIQQCGRQIGFDIEVAGRSLIVFCNPFPLLPNHVTIATVEHVDQSWVTGPPLKQVVDVLLGLSVRLPDWVVFFNGPGAGASIPKHRHWQAGRRRPGALFPLEEATVRCELADGAQLLDYPVPVLRYSGTDSAAVSDAVTRTAERWAGFGDWATLNLMASSPDSQRVTAYLIPRFGGDGAPGLAGDVACIEIFGALVFSTEHEKRMLDTGEVDYNFVARVLLSARPPNFERFLKSLDLSEATTSVDGPTSNRQSALTV